LSRCKKNFCVEHALREDDDLYFVKNAGRYYDLWLKKWVERASWTGNSHVRIDAFTLCKEHTVIRLFPWLEMTEEEITRRCKYAEVVYDKHMRARKVNGFRLAEQNPMMHRYR